MQSSLFDDNSQSERLSSGFPDRLAILDCETTGGKASYHRIIEIGVVLIDSGEVVDQWQQFINPNTSIPPQITALTGIKQIDVADAPSFDEIADHLLELLEGRVLVAHNARFDYSFLRNEYERIGQRFSAKLLCSVKFSRAMYPQFRSHSLSNIIRRFNFSVENRHRALDDSLMVLRLFQKSSELFSDEDIKATCDKILKSPTLPPKLDSKEIDKLPNGSGVYYFYDDKGGLLYIGKSVNIRNRVLNHFSQDHKNHKDLKMGAQIAHIDYQQTASDFSAQLLESQLIKKLLPTMNVRLRRVKKLFSVELIENAKGYLQPKTITIEVAQGNTHQAHRYGLFRSAKQISGRLEKLADQFFLCHQLLGLETSRGNKACFRFQLKRCFGACCGEEGAEKYNERVRTALKDYRTKAWPWQSAVLVKEANANRDAQTQLHLIDNWVYIAKLDFANDIYDFGYAMQSEDKSTPSSSETNKVQTPLDFDLDTYLILVRFLLSPEKRKLNGLEVIPLVAAIL
ncbi:MAG: GIY-YIG nuclease family protein [Acidiferrobacterales bacterium]|nr:GIY-YIG nuclease family protein [Acidiferrobacterales bacterium]